MAYFKGPDGQLYDSDLYAIRYNGNEKEVVKKDDFDATKGSSVKEMKQQAYQGQDNKVQANAAGTVTNAPKTTDDNRPHPGQAALKAVGNSLNQAAGSAVKMQGQTDPQQQHYRQQALLAQNDAARMKAQAQENRQEAYRNQGDRALTESAKIGEAATAAQVRNMTKANSAEMGGAAGTLAAQKASSINPMENAMALRQQGYNRQDVAFDQANRASTAQTAAEQIRSDATTSGEQYKQAQAYNEQAKEAAMANAERRALEDAKLKAETSKLEAEAGKATAESENTTTQTAAETKRQNQEDAAGWRGQVDAVLSSKKPQDLNREDARLFINYYISNSNAKPGGGKEALEHLTPYMKGPDGEAIRREFADLYFNERGNPRDSAGGVQVTNWLNELASTLSDSRLKNIIAPLAKIHNGRT